MKKHTKRINFEIEEIEDDALSILLKTVEQIMKELENEDVYTITFETIRIENKWSYEDIDTVRCFLEELSYSDSIYINCEDEEE